MTEDSVLVVGAGQVGLALALSLAQAGVRVTVVEARPALGTLSGDIVYQWFALPSLAELGVLDDLLEVGTAEPHTAYQVWSSGETLGFDLGVLADEDPYPFNLLVEQQDMTGVLMRHLARQPNARVILGAAVVDIRQDARGVEVSCDTEHGGFDIAADWLVGADGAHSVVRRQLGLAFPGMTWPERLVSVEMNGALEDIGIYGAGLIVDPRHGAIVTSVQPGKRWRYVYAEDRALPEELIESRVPGRVAAGLGPGFADAVEEWSASRLHERSAPTFRVNRALLVGDAAHLTNSSTAMGAVSGIFDALELSAAFVRVLEGENKGAHEHPLDTFARRRRHNFIEYVSPAASERKKFIYNLPSDAAVEREVEPYRRAAADKDAMRAYFHSLESDQGIGQHRRGR